MILLFYFFSSEFQNLRNTKKLFLLFQYFKLLTKVQNQPHLIFIVRHNFNFQISIISYFKNRDYYFQITPKILLCLFYSISVIFNSFLVLKIYILFKNIFLVYIYQMKRYLLFSSKIILIIK